MSSEGICKGCQAAILWVRLNGRWHPVNPKKLSIVIDEAGGRLVSGHESHYATCPKADTFRKPKG